MPNLFLFLLELRVVLVRDTMLWGFSRFMDWFCTTVLLLYAIVSNYGLLLDYFLI